ncbi:anti-sigma factor [Aldersonia sp. NBC_00410]|uniref:anti-sigma factor n=1 Tax=Aldersonia sp. NBC_00410 TaxID=2975954 RepID=UPI00224F21CA|nr:anti-sigma factor [Aldersonia sp. NBC_00410]MCX5044337.1 anti-sigma factor [Aldersonia sp. NBC_00410]
MTDDELIGMAYPYALDALDDNERRAVEADLAAAQEGLRAAFTDEVRVIRETLAAVSDVGAVTPSGQVRERVLAQIRSGVPPDALALKRRSRRRRQLLAAAAAIVVAVGAVVAVQALTDEPAPAVTAEQVLDEPDVHSATAPIPGGGMATVSYSPAADALVLVMDGVTPPPADVNYQMWLMSDAAPAVSAGTMSAQDVAPTTTVVVDDVGSAQKLGFTVEPPGGSATPTSEPFAVIDLV